MFSARKIESRLPLRLLLDQLTMLCALIVPNFIRFSLAQALALT